MNKQLEALKKAAAAENQFLDDQDMESPEPPNPEGQKAVSASNGNNKPQKKMGRPKTGSIPVEIELSEFDRPNDSMPTFFVSGQSGRKGTVSKTLSIPVEIHDRIQKESANANATYVALLKYALDTLDRKKKGLSIKHIKKI